ncbi:MAG: polysaccharide-degrading enzyme [Phycisphaerae bacterium]|nr:polysaccharide-degrading enzyme [Phycisphaerae bacterium]
MGRVVTIVIIAASIAISLVATEASGTTFEVGDGMPYATIGAVPWESVSAGDVVLIHWRSSPYREKWVIGRAGTANEPIVVSGVAGPNGALPIIDGENATTRLALDYWNEPRSVIKVGGSSIPSNTLPQYVVIENLDIRGARPPNAFTDDAGGVQNYAANAAAIHVERGEHITIRNCILRDSGNGLFVSSSDEEAASDILIDGNYIHGNGNVGSIYEHNVYVAGIGMVFQYNRFGSLQDGAGGNNLKDRSAGLVIRYNWIEGGNRQLDLVDGEDSALIRSDPGYTSTFVYGNILIEPAGEGNKQIVHYGGDSGTTSAYRNGTLYFYHNTVVSLRTDSTTLFRLSTNDNHCDARNNIFFVTTAGSGLAALDSDGVLDLSHNWLKPGWVDSFGGLGGMIHDDGTSIETNEPGFADFAGQDFTLAADSDCIDGAAPLSPGALPDHRVERQYVKHQSGRDREQAGSASDLGAYEANGPAAVPTIPRCGVGMLSTLILAGGMALAGRAARARHSGAETPDDRNH